VSVSNIVCLDDYRKRRAALPEPPREVTVAEAIEISLRRPELLNAWEKGFLVSLHRFRRLSDKQLAVLQRIFDRICTSGEERAP